MILPSIGLSSFGLGSFPEESNVLQLRKTSRDRANKKRANVFILDNVFVFPPIICDFG